MTEMRIFDLNILFAAFHNVALQEELNAAQKGRPSGCPNGLHKRFSNKSTWRNHFT